LEKIINGDLIGAAIFADGATNNEVKTSGKLSQEAVDMLDQSVFKGSAEEASGVFLDRGFHGGNNLRILVLIGMRGSTGRAEAIVRIGVENRPKIVAEIGFGGVFTVGTQQRGFPTRTTTGPPSSTSNKTSNNRIIL